MDYRLIWKVKRLLGEVEKRIFLEGKESGYRVGVSVVIRFDAVTRFRNESAMTQLRNGRYSTPRIRPCGARRIEKERETKGRAEVLVIKAFRQTYIAETGYPGAFRSCIPGGWRLLARLLDPLALTILWATNMRNLAAQVGTTRLFFPLYFPNPSLPGLPCIYTHTRSIHLIDSFSNSKGESIVLLLDCIIM